MPCKHYKDPLIESAASGARPKGDLSVHLAGCVVCRATFAEEQALFSSIDAGLHVTANAEMPASLLPRVRARLVEAAAPRRMWTPNWFALAGTTAMVVAFVAARALWRTNFDQVPGRTATNVSTSAPVVPPTQSQDPNVPPSMSKNSVSPPRTARTMNTVPRETLASHNTALEVLVPRDQEDLLVGYAQQWNQRKHAPLVAANFDATNMSPLQISLIQIAQLDVKLMTEEQAQ